VWVRTAQVASVALEVAIADDAASELAASVEVAEASELTVVLAVTSEVAEATSEAVSEATSEAVSEAVSEAAELVTSVLVAASLFWLLPLSPPPLWPKRWWGAGIARAVET
jgi:hypothetical protein